MEGTLERVKRSTSGQVEWKQTYRLRHVASGKWLVVDRTACYDRDDALGTLHNGAGKAWRFGGGGENGRGELEGILDFGRVGVWLVVGRCEDSEL